MKTKIFSLLIACSFVLAGLALRTTGVQAGSSIEATTQADELNTDGDCSLREAVRAANLDQAVDACPAGSGWDTILVPAGTYLLSLAGAGEDQAAAGDLDLTAAVTIRGKDPKTTIIDANGIDRVFHIPYAVQVVLENLTIQHGVASGAGGLGRGGGLYNKQATLTITNSVIQGNQASGTGGGIDNFGGTLTLTTCAVQGNLARDGAGIFNGGTVVITRSLLADNVSDQYGGGLDNNEEATLINVTLSGNSAALDPTDPQGLRGMGGGLFSDGNMTLLNTTIANNTGDGFLNKGNARFMNVILADNGSFNCSGVGAFASEGHNLEDADQCAFHQSSDQVNTDPLLGALAYHDDSLLRTQALLDGSPAIDAAADLDCPFTDQRLALRPADGNQDGVAACDIGAYEFGAVFGRVYLPLALGQ
jgi:CSLREA domain-containing protein